MKMNIKNITLSTAIIMMLGVYGISFAAESAAEPTASLEPSMASVVSPQSTDAPSVRISRKKATEIALKTHPNAKLIDIKLYGQVYVAHLDTDMGKYTIKVGGNSGKVLMDKPSAGSATPAPTIKW
jgi:uncharacterized membrane protein YkoI